MNSILAVVDWIKYTLLASFFNPSQPCRARLRIHNEFCPVPFFSLSEIFLSQIFILVYFQE